MNNTDSSKSPNTDPITRTEDKPTDKYHSNQTFKQGQFKTLLMPCKDCVELAEGVYRCERIERQSLWEFTHTLTFEMSKKRVVI